MEHNSGVFQLGRLSSCTGKCISGQYTNDIKKQNSHHTSLFWGARKVRFYFPSFFSFFFSFNFVCRCNIEIQLVQPFGWICCLWRSLFIFFQLSFCFLTYVEQDSPGTRVYDIPLDRHLFGDDVVENSNEFEMRWKVAAVALGNRELLEGYPHLLHDAPMKEGEIISFRALESIYFFFFLSFHSPEYFNSFFSS